MKISLIMSVRNKSLLVLLIILLSSTLTGTFIQFLKGDIFQNAIELKFSHMSLFIIFLGLTILFEVLLYYIEWLYENKLIKEALAKQKISVGKTLLNLKYYKDIENIKENNLNKLTNIIDSLEYSYYKAFFDVLYLLFRVLFVSVALIYINIYVGLIVMLMMFLPLLITKLFKNKLAHLEEKLYEQKGVNLKFYKNLMDNLKYIKVFELRNHFYRKFISNVEEEKKDWATSKNYQVTLNAAYSLSSYLSHFIVLTIAIYLVYKNAINPGTVITLLGLVDQLSMPILSLSRNINSINSTKKLRSQLSNNYNTIDDSELVTIDFKDKIHASGLELNIKNYNLIYKDVEFCKNKKHLIIGRSGIGKSIFIDALLGLSPIDAGVIQYDDKQLNEHGNPLKKTSYIMTENILFDETVLYNIIFSNNADEIQYAFIKKLLPDNIIFEKSIDKLSSGEKRRVLLLRGLMSDKETLVFDEPTSNLDESTSQVFWDLLMNINHKTVIIISHNTPQYISEKFDYIIDFANYVERNRDT
ncbi:TPA: ABC transporter ATP-binding protein [Staphylococcus delphini]|nr:ABC transporter ATP-binding protein [Staphylococcus delphini]